MSLNVNGICNPVKRAKIMTKLKKEKTQITFLQETHLSKIEHEKLRKFGFKNSFYSSHTNSRKRGVAILITNSLKFQSHKEIKDKEGRYVIVKGVINQTMVTLMNVYAPPESNKEFFKLIFDILVLEAEGICICGGDFNVILDSDLDTTSLKKKFNSKISKIYIGRH